MAEPTLYVVATPIGNLQDITLRALDILKAVHAIAAEDTRVSRKLLAHFGIQADLISAHEHNERAAAQRLLALLAQGKSVALISDAGTPGISDPGTVAVEQVRAAGFRVVPIPGACAITTALAAAGMPCATFCFQGFLPARKGEREKILMALKAHTALQIFYEAPHRIVDCVASLAAVFGGGRRVGIARELTKLFEQVHVCRLDEAVAWLERSENHRRGEFVILVEGCADAAAPDKDEPRRVLEILLEALPLKQAVGLAAEITRTKKNALYEAALKLKEGAGGE
ncbi:MAG: 16S rRNA (cytidine(1402)-2'-O)-methyltransferase [Betaproteobacteria bacterium]